MSLSQKLRKRNSFSRSSSFALQNVFLSFVCTLFLFLVSHIPVRRQSARSHTYAERTKGEREKENAHTHTPNGLHNNEDTTVDDSFAPIPEASWEMNEDEVHKRSKIKHIYHLHVARMGNTKLSPLLCARINIRSNAISKFQRCSFTYDSSSWSFSHLQHRIASRHIRVDLCDSLIFRLQPHFLWCLCFVPVPFSAHLDSFQFAASSFLVSIFLLDEHC